MSSFTEMPPLQPLAGGVLWRITADLTYYEGEEGSDCYVLVPKDAVTDFASVPQVLWNIFPPWGLYGPAAVVHDQLYTDKQMVVGGVVVPIPRAKADAIFLEAMGVLGVPYWKRSMMYAGVRAGGWMAWKDKAETAK